ncbi:HlyD family efflux transporter periplasmic adaptor subunit [Thiofaba sp. EF100]|uniref:efflux RND transporter periplasmic adaptor subunit n=1 Tax=Thiofaba sp. EF100 TaxID=3121274 RepID=UPI003222118D
MQLRSRLGIILITLAVAGGLAFGFMPRPIPVELASAVRGPLKVTVEEEGKTRVMERYVIVAPMSGYARRITWKVGDAVRAGEELVVIEPARSAALDPRSRAQALAQVQAAEARLAAAHENARAAAAQAELAGQTLARVAGLRKDQFVAQQDLDRARTEQDRARAAKLAAEHAVNVARFELETARVTLEQTERLQAGGPAETLSVRAPVGARVLKVARESEGPVQAGQTLLEIGDPQALEVEVEVLSTQAVRIAPGTRVLFDRWGGESTLEGVVRVVEPFGYTKVSALGVEEQRVRVIADFVSPREQWQRLGDGYRVEARFVVWAGDDVLQIPASALFRRNGGWAVFVVQDGRARLTPVEIGQRAGLTAEVVSGLAPGEQVISHPDDTIRDGVRVRPR